MNIFPIILFASMICSYFVSTPIDFGDLPMFSYVSLREQNILPRAFLEHSNQVRIKHIIFIVHKIVCPNAKQVECKFEEHEKTFHFNFFLIILFRRSRVGVRSAQKRVTKKD